MNRYEYEGAVYELEGNVLYRIDSKGNRRFFARGNEAYKCVAHIRHEIRERRIAYYALNRRRYGA